MGRSRGKSGSEVLNLCHGESGETFTEIGQEVKTRLRGPSDEIFDELSLRSTIASNQL